MLKSNARLMVAVCLALAACQRSPATAPADDTNNDTNTPAAPPGADTAGPFPIDRGDDGVQTPGTYKGLWLRLVNNGAPSVTAVDGLIGVVCVGMSNANQECGEFINRLGGEYAAAVNSAVRVINCAVGGHAIERWNDPAYDGALWDDCVTRKLAGAGVRIDQVRVVYHKAANQFTSGPGGVPLPAYPNAGSDYENFHRNLGTFSARVAAKFPAVSSDLASSTLIRGNWLR
jgi:hypothetical protein